MTCIVAIAEYGTVYMGGDSAATTPDLILLADGGKIVQKPEGYLIGSTGSFRLIQVLLHQFRPPLPPADVAELAAFMSGLFVDALRDCLKTAGFAREVSGQEGAGNSTLLVAVAGRLFLVFGDYGVVEPREPWAAIGSGDLVALGSLHSTWCLPADVRVRHALEAAAHYSTTVAGPFTYVALPAVTGSQEGAQAA